MIADEGPQHKRPVDQVIVSAEEIRELHRRPWRLDYLVWGKLGVMAGERVERTRDISSSSLVLLDTREVEKI